MHTKGYIKKILIHDELSTPDARAERLKRLRNLTNLSRKELCEFTDLNLNTYKGWELGRYGGLPADGAEKIVNQAIQYGVICTTDWLLYGREPPPSLSSHVTTISSDEDNSDLTPFALIQREFSVFQNTVNHAVLEQVEDDSALPNFKKGDYVAGVKKYGKEIGSVVDYLCIVQTIDGKKMIRYVKKGFSDDLYTLICINPLSKSQDLAILNTKLVYAAPISRHYIINYSHSSSKI
jgi:transcriptional regulator with XRE-family HTH domain